MVNLLRLKIISYNSYPTLICIDTVNFHRPGHIKGTHALTYTSKYCASRMAGHATRDYFLSVSIVRHYNSLQETLKSHKLLDVISLNFPLPSCAATYPSYYKNGLATLGYLSSVYLPNTQKSRLSPTIAVCVGSPIVYYFILLQYIPSYISYSLYPQYPATEYESTQYPAGLRLLLTRLACKLQIIIAHYHYFTVNYESK